MFSRRHSNNHQKAQSLNNNESNIWRSPTKVKLEYVKLDTEDEKAQNEESKSKELKPPEHKSQSDSIRQRLLSKEYLLRSTSKLQHPLRKYDYHMEHNGAQPVYLKSTSILTGIQNRDFSKNNSRNNSINPQSISNKPEIRVNLIFSQLYSQKKSFLLAHMIHLRETVLSLKILSLSQVCFNFT